MKTLLAILVSIPLVFLAVGCKPSQAVPVQTMQAYLTAFSAKDENTLISLTCKEWQDQALLEYDSFGNVTTELKAVTCKLTGQSTNAQGEKVYSVNCTGAISASYNGELRTFDLSKRVYQVVDRGGSLQVCGY
jgi:hypothetical protein